MDILTPKWSLRWSYEDPERPWTVRTPYHVVVERFREWDEALWWMYASIELERSGRGPHSRVVKQGAR